MICPQCGAETWGVDRSLHADSSKKRKGYQRSALDRVQALVGVYTQDFVLRRRNCTICGHKDWFVEMPIDDLRGVIDLHVERGGVVDQVVVTDDVPQRRRWGARTYRLVGILLDHQRAKDWAAHQREGGRRSRVTAHSKGRYAVYVEEGSAKGAGAVG